MFKKIKKLLSIEDRLQFILNEASSRIQKKLDEVTDQLFNIEKMSDKIKAEFNERMSRFEVLFKDELEEKEKKRDEIVKEHIKKSGHV